MQWAAKKKLRKIITKKADYVFGLKGNQCLLHDDVRTYFESEKAGATFSTFEKGHGRIEKRTYFLETNIDWLWQKSDWAGLCGIGAVQSRITEKGKVREETRYFITSLNNVNSFAKAVREHWGIENGLHWCLDTTFGEDSARARKDNSPLNLNILRKTAMALLMPIKNTLSYRCSMYKAALNPDFLISAVFAVK